jgi:uncharacterized 2Fe-2S/4Fe-4S cluster protein (DUF4445 family)
MTGRVPVTFFPAGVTVWVERGTTVLAASRSADLVLPAPCGGRGVCGACAVRVVSGQLAEPDEQELAGLRSAPAPFRLACRARVDGPCEIRPVLAQPTGVHAPSDGAALPLVAGVDLGTTSVAALLVDAASGREVARASVPNRQQSFGADVLTRMSAALDGSSAELKEAAEISVVSAIRAAAALGGVQTAGIERLVIAANSAMIALLFGVDVAPLATSPFTPASAGGELPADSRLRTQLGPGALATVMPPIAGFVGGDAVAAAIAAGLAEADTPVLLVDFGTNAEIVLAGCGSLIVASAAAGPAFEGAGISCGGPAAEGAVTSVEIGSDGSVELTSLGAEAPRWFSGSGIVSAVAELRRAGHVQADGLLVADGPLKERFTVEAGVVTVSLDNANGRLTVSQLDVRSLQLAKAAVRVGITAVLESAGIGGGDLTALSVAGAFGSALSVADLVELGVVPSNAASVISPVGNAALQGAAVVALDPGLLGMALSMAAQARHLDLAGDPGFAAALMVATELAPFAIGD